MKKVWNALRSIFYIPAVIAAIIGSIFFVIATICALIAGIDKPLKK